MTQNPLPLRPDHCSRTSRAVQVFVADVQALKSNPKKLAFFLSLTTGAFSLYIAIPVLFIAGNDLGFYISITPWWGFLLLFLLALQVGFALTFRILSGPCTQCSCKKGVAKNSALITASVVPSVLTCPILAVSVLSFILPVASVWTLVGYRWLIVLIALLSIFAITALRYWKLAYSPIPS